LVTGGAGFIGSRLADRLVEKKYNVTVVDNLFSGSRGNLKYIDKIQFLEGDIRDESIVNRCLKGQDAVIHLAAIISIPYSMIYPDETFDVNSVGTLKLLKEALKNNISRFIFISTCAVYGEARYLPIDEEHPLDPLSPYASSKLFGEYFCVRYSRLYKFPTLIYRVFNVYGPGQGYSDYSGVITKFINRVMNGAPPIIYGDGYQTRDFIYLDDIVDAVIMGIEYKQRRQQIFNIGSGRATSIIDLAKMILDLMDMKSLKPIHEEKRKGDIVHSHANIARVRIELGFEPKISLKEGLKRTIEEFRALKK